MNTKTELPIDIQFTKLLEWLIDRKKVPLKWQDPIRKVHDRLAVAKATTSSTNVDVVAALKKDVLTYFECKQLFQILETDEGTSAKNIFGQYNSPSLKNWHAVIKAWEKDNVYLGESSRLLIQWASHECPAMKKILTSSEKQVADINRRINEYEKTIQNCKRLRSELSKEWGIEGNNDHSLKSELLQLTKSLPAIYEEIESLILENNFRNCIEYFFIIIEFLSNNNTTNIRERYLPKIQSLLRGDRMRLKNNSNNPNNSDVISNITTDINWNATDTNDTSTFNTNIGNNDINFDISTEGFEVEVVDWNVDSNISHSNNFNMNEYAIEEISWDMNIETSHDDVTAAAGVGVDIGSDVIQWDINGDNTENNIDSYSGNSYTAFTKTNATNNLIITKEELLSLSASSTSTSIIPTQSLLCDMTFRELLQDDIDELRAFLTQRLNETVAGDHLQLSSISHMKGSATGNTSASNSTSTSTTSMTMKSIDDIKNYIILVDNIDEKLKDSKLRQLNFLKDKKSYLDRTIKNFLAHSEKATKIRSLCIEAEDRKIEILSTIAELGPRVEALRTSTKDLKVHLEKELGKLLQ
eukprot:gene8878-18380_t